MTETEFNSVDVSYLWERGLRQLAVSVPVAESGKSEDVNMLAARAVAKELVALNKVVIYKGKQVAGDWAARNYVVGSRTEVTVQAWGEPFNIAVYDAS